MVYLQATALCGVGLTTARGMSLCMTVHIQLVGLSDRKALLIESQASSDACGSAFYGSKNHYLN